MIEKVLSTLDGSSARVCNLLEVVRGLLSGCVYVLIVYLVLWLFLVIFGVYIIITAL